MSGAETRETVDRDVSIETFVDRNPSYFNQVFERLQRGQLPRWHLNIWGLLIPWAWAAWRGVWLMFWLALAIDVLAIVCLMQVIKFAPLLAEAQLDPDANRTLIPRYSGWINTYGTIGWLLLIGGRLWMGSSANRWYYGQYNRWRINFAVPNGVAAKRVVIGLVIMAICAPLTTYRATQLRLDERACLTQVRTGETVEDLMARFSLPDVAALEAKLVADVATLQAEFDRLDAIADPTDAQKTERSEARKLLRDTGRPSGQRWRRDGQIRPEASRHRPPISPLRPRRLAG